jgi:NitT/TauT family transport system substrate-binding protein
MLGLLGAATAPVLHPAPALAQSLPLRIGATPSETFAEPFYAADAGFLKRAGFDATVSPFQNGGVAANAVAGGALDVSLADPIVIANASKRGLPFVAIAGGALYLVSAPTTFMCVLKESPITAARDLAGKTIGIASLASITTLAVKAWLEAGGVDLSTVKLFELNYPQMVPALQRGQLAAAFVSETFLVGNRNDVRILGSCYDAIAKACYISVWYTTRDFVAKNPDAVKRLQEAVYQTARWANAHHNESATILAQHSGMQLDLIKQIHRVSYSTTLDPKLMQPVLDSAAKYKLADPVNASSLMATI